MNEADIWSLTCPQETLKQTPDTLENTVASAAIDSRGKTVSLELFRGAIGGE